MPAFAPLLPRPPIGTVLLGLLALILGATACFAADPSPTGRSRAEVYHQVDAMAEVGQILFSDPALSASGRLSCASCHSPQNAYGPPNGLAVQLGGPRMRSMGTRAVPSLRYLQAIPAFTEHFFESDDEGDDSIDNGPTGGLTWDGRVDRLRDQAKIPLLSPVEMANASPAAIVATVRAAPYADALRGAFGDSVFDHPDTTFNAILEALEVYQQRSASFYPYSSRYDAYLAGRATLSPAEQHGLALFEDPAKGNCARCHVSRPDANGTPPQFTDYGLVALGVPRNRTIAVNADPDHYDLGLCGPDRTDMRTQPHYCGLFMTPTLRNVATRHSFFHNGVIHSLKEAIAFYVERDTKPEKWYPPDADGKVHKFDDLWSAYVGNVEMDAPFGGQPGDPPALSEAEIDDMVAFLRTLTDADQTSN
ncbi:MAG: cytochrome c peroxidase [Azospirillaceae bacterium]|nr:cytochrome c peroxidase [Azospirillaceae bacterium]